MEWGIPMVVFLCGSFNIHKRLFGRFHQHDIHTQINNKTTHENTLCARVREIIIYHMDAIIDAITLSLFFLSFVCNNYDKQKKRQ